MQATLNEELKAMAPERISENEPILRENKDRFVLFPIKHKIERKP